MAKIRLTARGVAALTTDRPQQDFWDDLLPGFGVRVNKLTGTKTWQVRYRRDGNHHRMKIGRYPAMSLAKAREAAKDTLIAVQAGRNPVQERRERRSADATFGALARDVLDLKAGSTREATRTERERMLDVELLPKWGKKPAASITRHDVTRLVDAIVARGAPVMANRVLALVKTIYNSALNDGDPRVENNPAHRLRPRGSEGGRDRHLEKDELKELWATLEKENPITRGAFRFALLTAARIGSVCSIRWEDVDDADVWRIPEEAFKGKRPHLVPLSAEALAVLEELRPISGSGEYVFPGRADGKSPHLASTNRALARIRKRSKLAHWTVHDFRTTFRTHATRKLEPKDKRDPAGLGVAPHVADAVLGHKEASLGFDRYTGDQERYLLAEKREALEKWGAFVREAVREKREVGA